MAGGPEIPLTPECCQVSPNVAVDSTSGATIAGWSQIGGPSVGLQILPVRVKDG